MRLSENRTLAWIVAAVCIVGSVFGLSNLRVAGDRNRVEQVFYEGEAKGTSTRHSMDKYLDDAAENAALMASEAGLRLNDTQETIDEMTALSAVVRDDRDLDKRYEAYVTLKKDADILYNAMNRAGITGDAFRNFKLAYDDFFGADKFIQKDAYHALAADFNRTLTGFPANLITGIGGVKPLNTFGG